MLLEFIKNYNQYNEEKTFNKHWKKLLEQAKKTDSIALYFHTLLEERLPFQYLKELIEYDEKGKKDIFNDDNSFKWACAFGHPYLILYLNDKVKDKNLPGAINATFLQYRLDNLKVLEVLGYEKEIYTEKNLCQAISRANQEGCSLHIVEHFFKNFDKFPQLSPYVEKELEKQEWIYKICRGEYEKTLEFCLTMKSSKFNNELIEKAENIVYFAHNEKKVKILDMVMNSYLKEDFVLHYSKVKINHLKDSLRLDEDNNLQYIITNYPQLIAREDITLWMMNSQSLTIKDYIVKNRALTTKEIKKSYLELCKEEDCFSKLLEITPDFDLSKFTIQEAIKIVNNYYQANKDIDNDIDYRYDSSYMKFNRSMLLAHKKFENHAQEIRQVIYDEKMFDLLYKEQIKNNMEKRLLPKPKVKQMKI